MDSELTDLAGVKGVTISTLQAKPSEGAFANGDKTKLDTIEESADVTDAANVLTSLPSGVVSGSSQISGVTNTQLAGSIAASKLAGSIGNSKLSNSAVTISGTSVSLGGSITDETLFGGTELVSGSAQITKNKSDVGLGNVDNTSDALKPVSTAGQTALDLKANLASPSLTGNPTAPTQADNDDSTKIATTAYVQREVSDLLGGAPAAFDTLLEISASIANGDSDVVALTTTVGTKLAKSSNLSDLSNAGTARTNLGVDAAGTDNSTDVTLAGNDYLTISGQQITAGTINNDDLANDGITIDGADISLGGSVSTLQLGTSSSTALAGNTTTISGGQASAITANTAKNTNVSTNLSKTTAAAQITINSSDGDNVVIAEASDTIAGLMSTTHHDKLDGIEASADVTDTANVTSAGALMDSEVTNLADVKSFDTSDYATSAQGTKADAALPKGGGAMTGAITTNSTFDGRDVATDGTKLDTIESSADVTDTANVTSAGALMDSELSSISDVKALDQSVVSGATPTFTVTNFSDVSNKRFMSDAQETLLNSVETNADVTDTANVKSSLNASLGGAANIGDGSDTITIPGDLVVTGTTTTENVTTLTTSNGIVFEGSVADDHEATLKAGTLSADRTLTLPNATGTIALTSDLATVGAGGLTQQNFTTTLKNKLDGIEGSADVTDASNVTSAGALMDSEVTNLSQVKSFDSSDYLASSVTTISGGQASAITANTAKVTNVSTDLSKTTATGQITIHSSDGDDVVIGEATGTIAGLMSTTHHDKLDGIEASATADQSAAEIRSLVGTGNGNLVPSAGTAGHFLQHDGTFGLPSYTTNTNTQLSTSDVRSKISATGNSQYNSSTGVITSTNTNTQLSQEQVEDFVGGMLGGTETGITVTYQDSTGDIDFVVASQTENDFTTVLKDKLDGIEASATADQSASEIRTLLGTGNSGIVPSAGSSGEFLKHDGTFGTPSYTTNTNTQLTQEQVEDFVGGMLDGTETGITVGYDDTNGNLDFVVASQTDENFTTADHSKLNGIEASATADQTDAEIRAAVEAASDSNVFTDDDHSKLNGIESSATADQSASEIRTLVGTGNGNFVPSAGSSGEFLKHDGTFGTPSYTTNTNTQNSAADIRTKIGSGNNGHVPTVGTAGHFLKHDGTFGLPSYTTNSDTQLSTEAVQDIVGAMFTGNTETRVSATYQDGDGTIDIVVNDMTANDNDDVSVANLKTRLAGGFGSDAVQIGDSNDTVTIPGDLVVTGTTTTNNVEVVSTTNGVVFEGSADDAHEGTLLAGTLSADRTYTLPNAGGTIALTSDLASVGDGGLTTKNFTSALKDKLDAIEASATADQTAAQIRTAIGTGNGNLVPSAGSSGEFLKHDGTFGTPSYTTNTNTQNSRGDLGLDTDDDVLFGTVSATGDIVAFASSDERLKDNIELISNPIEKVQALRGVTWNWNSNADILQQTLPNVGVIAQDVEKVLPSVG